MAEEFEEELTSTGKASIDKIGFEVVAQGWGDWNSEGGLNAMEDIITAHPDINTLLAENDNMAIGAMNAIEEAGLTDKVKILAGADGQKEAYKLIQDGRYEATSENNPVKIVGMAYDILKEIINDGKDPYSYPKQIETDPVCINADNVGDYYDPNALF
jgi:ribose transport system substrate-binding protein